MSAPETELETQKRRPGTPLKLLLLVVAAAILGILAWTAFVVDEGGTPDGANLQVDGRTGEVEPASE